MSDTQAIEKTLWAGYPPEKQEGAEKTIREQARTIGDGLLHGVGEEV